MKILLVEDDPAIRDVERAYLEDAGHTVVECADGNDALARFGTSAFDLVVLDLNLPGQDGLALCRAIRHASAIPIIMVTARTGDLDELIGLETGADDYVRKPFNPRLLVARVSALLRRAGNDQLTVGPFQLDPETMRVSRDGESIALTTTQFNIFYRLARHEGGVLSRDQLLDASHGGNPGREAFDRTIDAHILAIRKRVEPEPSRPRYIQTVIGRGYRFVLPNERPDG